MFERFTGDARTTVVLAQVQARALGHPYIGTEHLLLSLLETGATPVGEILVQYGVKAEDVRAEILAIVGEGEGAPPGHIPFTPRSKKVLELSLREALQLKHPNIAPEHILLGLLREGEGLAAQILFKRGVDLVKLRQDVIEGMPPGTARRGLRRRTVRGLEPQVARAMTPGAAKAADRAWERAGGAPVASQHYLLGLLDEDDSLAAKALAALGVTRDEVEAKLAELGTQGTSDEPPAQVGARNTSLEVQDDLVTVKFGDGELAARIRQSYNAMQVEILRGALLPEAERIWLAVRPAVEASVRRIEEMRKAATEWEPPGWAQAGVATYAVLSKPGGPTGQLWLAPGAEEEIVRNFLADWLAGSLPGARVDEPTAYLVVGLSRAGDVVPDAADPEALLVSQWSSGPGGPLLDWPRRPLRDLVAAGVEDLSQESAA